MLRHSGSRLQNPQLQRVAAAHEPLAVGRQSFLLLACGGSLSFEFLVLAFKRCRPEIRIGLKRPGEEQQGREFCTQRRRIFVAMLRQRHTLAQRRQLAAQLLVLRRRRAWIVIRRTWRGAGQHELGGRGTHQRQQHQQCE